jgi:hypothetical protein
MDSNYSQLNLMIKILYLSGDFLKKNNYKSLNLQNYLQEFKLKLLSSESPLELEYLNANLNRLVKQDLDTLLLLKILHTINFQDSLDQQHSNRSLLNTIDCTYSKITNSLTNDEIESLEKDPYILTLLIQNLYTFYKIYYQVKVR